MRTNRLPQTKLYCITARELSLGRTNIEVVKQLLEAGVKIIQYREKELSMSAKYQECLSIRELCSHYNACFIVNDDVGLALAVDADGIHLGQNDLPPEIVRKLIGDKMLLGFSVSSTQDALSVIKAGIADYLGVGPIFVTKTKKDAAAPMGLESLEHLKDSAIPIVAIGGINEQNVAEVIAHGAHFAAIISDIVGAPNIGDKVRRMQNILQNKI